MIGMVKLDPIAEFREDHRKVRDGLLELMGALQSKDIVKARKILDTINVLVGPHFRYEEEVLYPTLRVFLGEYVDQLLTEHDGVIATARSCAELLKKDHLTDEEAKLAVSAARALLIHVSNCDGLSILSERLSKNEVDALSEKLVAARKAGVSLLDWAETIRKK
ncbi:MAG: hemerythrin domain-containing protein [Candidatus Brocadia sp. BROELEC01]|nr:hemerythrin domain-containing protein [Candidatus Brocadia sapporoensis]QQR66539.1 MAG: hemerythrin domain-containing protein [Candidatus Brocadia sp.]RZV57011.1 MAG: hemerythrin domain-containing protein [Candidatus Brocadia sp. BROELEC01]